MKLNVRNVLVVTVVAAVLYAIAIFLTDAREIGRVLGAMDGRMMLLALALSLGNYLIRFGKWEYYLRHLGCGIQADGEPFRPVPRAESLSIYFSGFAMSVTPGKVGEVFRSVLLASARGIPVARTAPIVIADRLTDLLALVILVALGGLALPGGTLYAGTTLALVSVVLAVTAIEPLAMGIVGLLERTGPGRTLGPRLRDAYGSLRRTLTPGALFWATAVSVLAWGCEATGLWVIAHGLHATDAAYRPCVFSYAAATIAGVLFPGGVGGTETAMGAMLYSLVHLPQSVATAATLLVRLATLWFAVALGFVALAVYRQKYDRSLDAVTASSGSTSS